MGLLEEMELQEAVTLLQLKGKTLTEQIIKQAYKAKVDQVQVKAINAPTSELVKKYMSSLKIYWIKLFSQMLIVLFSTLNCEILRVPLRVWC